jgi:hypothetical protein
VTPLPPSMRDLESLISTAKLRRRPSRAPRDAAENRALVALAQAMTVSPIWWQPLDQPIDCGSVSGTIVGHAQRGSRGALPVRHGATFQFVLPSCGRLTS